MIVDYTGSYALSYYIIGVGISCSGFILMAVLVYDRIEERQKKKEQTEIKNDNRPFNAIV
jgi:hypothetical protein